MGEKQYNSYVVVETKWEYWNWTFLYFHWTTECLLASYYIILNNWGVSTHWQPCRHYPMVELGYLHHHSLGYYSGHQTTRTHPPMSHEYRTYLTHVWMHAKYCPIHDRTKTCARTRLSLESHQICRQHLSMRSTFAINLDRSIHAYLLQLLRSIYSIWQCEPMHREWSVHCTVYNIAPNWIAVLRPGFLDHPPDICCENIKDVLPNYLIGWIWYIHCGFMQYVSADALISHH